MQLTKEVLMLGFTSGESARRNPRALVRVPQRLLPSLVKGLSHRCACMRPVEYRQSAGSSRYTFEAQPSSSVAANFSDERDFQVSTRTMPRLGSPALQDLTQLSGPPTPSFRCQIESPEDPS